MRSPPGASQTRHQLWTLQSAAQGRRCCAGCAGGYMLESRGAWLIESVEGDWLNGIGLPVLALVTRLRARGWRLPTVDGHGPTPTPSSSSPNPAEPRDAGI